MTTEEMQKAGGWCPLKAAALPLFNHWYSLLEPGSPQHTCTGSQSYIWPMGCQADGGREQTHMGSLQSAGEQQGVQWDSGYAQAQVSTVQSGASTQRQTALVSMLHSRATVTHPPLRRCADVALLRSSYQLPLPRPLPLKHSGNRRIRSPQTIADLSEGSPLVLSSKFLSPAGLTVLVSAF